jgi:hypothetical protein
MVLQAFVTQIGCIKMYVNGIQCDACTKIDNTTGIGLMHEKLPKEWLAVKDGNDCDLLHFCSLHCLHDWVEKQFPVVEEVKPMSEMFPDAFKTINPPAILSESQVKNIVPDEYWRGL